MKNTSGYAFTLGSRIFSWASKKQATVAQSSAEAEYIAAATTTSQTNAYLKIWESHKIKLQRFTETANLQ